MQKRKAEEKERSARNCVNKYRSILNKKQQFAEIEEIKSDCLTSMWNGFPISSLDDLFVVKL